MSNRYKGAVISATPPTTSGGPTGVASGAWTLEQQLQLQAASLWPSQPPPPNIEDVFSCFLYTGNNSTQTITNNIDLAGKGGLVILKNRSNGSFPFFWWDSARGVNALFSDRTDAQQNYTGDFVSLNSNGFSLGSPTNTFGINGNNYSQVSWTFREQAKFFDVVTYTGTGSNTTIAHSLGSVPGSIIVKRTDVAANWAVYHRSLANTQYLVLNSTAAAATGATWWNSTTPTSSVFSLGTDASVNASGGTYVAYLFAHDAGGFGLTGTDNVISCGSFTADVTNSATVNLGYEPQWILVKNASAVNGWAVVDTMRGLPADGSDRFLFANSSAAESGGGLVNINATGFYGNGTVTAFETYIYIAIRRGPMAVPTVGTSVFSPTSTATATSPGATATTNFPVDLSIYALRDLAGLNSIFFDRLRGTSSTSSKSLVSSGTAAEASSGSNGIGIQSNTTVTENWTGGGGYTNILWNFRRAPSFFDEVCYTGTGSATTFSHNLTVAPQMMIVKRRSGSADWTVYHVAMGATKYTFLDGSTELTGTMWNNTAPTSSVFSVDDSYYVNYAANTYVAYLFATCADVSKVGSYTGTGALQTVNCGFTTGARFVLIHRIDSGSNNWWIYDSARGITSGNDPYLFLNSTSAEVTGTNYVDTTSVGFQVTAAAPAELNATGGTYIFLAIA